MAMPFIILSRGNNLSLLRQMMWTLPLLFVLGNLLLQLPLSSNAFTITVSSNIAPSNRNALSASSTTDSSGISSPTDNHDSHETLSTKRLHPAGSIVTIDCCLVPEGDFIPEPLFDGIVLHETCLLPEENDEQEENDVYSSSRDSLQQEETLNSSSSSSSAAAAVSPCQQLTFVLDQGNYLPGLHDLVAHLALGQTVSQVSLDAGWGSYNPQNVLTLQYAQAGITDPSSLRQGAQLVLQQPGGQQIPCIVTELTEATFTLDANPPLAGASYQATVTLHSVSEPVEIRPYNDVSSRSDNNRYQVATFALGCFWGGELAFQRHQGVVGTAVGYTQGTVVDPTYQQVCSGTTGHTEAIAVTYDAQQVSYEALVQLAMDRLGSDKYLLDQVGNDKGTQYRHGIYYHTVSQKHVASQIVESYGPDCVTECLPATEFYRAEDYHQQYLLKGGQSARKNDPTAIRCYG